MCHFLSWDQIWENARISYSQNPSRSCINALRSFLFVRRLFLEWVTFTNSFIWFFFLSSFWHSNGTIHKVKVNKSRIRKLLTIAHCTANFSRQNENISYDEVKDRYLTIWQNKYIYLNLIQIYLNKRKVGFGKNLDRIFLFFTIRIIRNRANIVENSFADNFFCLNTNLKLC